MPTLLVDLAPDVYRDLDAEASRLGEPPERVIGQWVTERLGGAPAAPISDREKVRQMLRDAGLLAELGPDLQKRADRGRHVNPEDVERAFARAGGKPLSEIVIEQRGPKG